jgi:hypothetical protein
LVVHPGGSGTPATISPSPRTLPGAPVPASVALKVGWQGLNYSSSSNSCSTSCLPADPDVAAGNGYVFEVANAAYRIWTSDGTLVSNASLNSLFGTGSDVLSSPQVRYDPTTLRWFASVEDVSKSQVFFGGSLSSDPTGSWNIQHFNPPGSDVPTQPILAVDALNLVVTTDLYQGGKFQGAQVWVANKTQLIHTGGVATWSDTPNPSNESLVPADPSGSSAVMYLLSDATGGPSLDLFALSGSPPGTPVLSAPVRFPSATAPPPGASQLGTSNLIDTGNARVQSAVWEAGTIWAAANVGCTPGGDATIRSCLHLWELSTSTDQMIQNFNWSSGAGTYDFFPSISVDPGGDLAVVFEESSASAYPGVYTTAQSRADPQGNLEPPQTVKAGTGPDNVSGQCPLGVCPFGNYSGVAFLPATGSSFWLVGEYTAADYATNSWHTWVRLMSVVNAYRVDFTETNLPAGTPWSITVNGAVASSTSPSIIVNETNGAYTFTVLTPIAGASGVRFVANTSAGSFSVASGPVNESIAYAEQFELSTSVSPAGAGTVSPSGGWFNASASVTLSALAGAGHAFSDWTGSGSGSYGGTSDPAVLTMDGPVSEQARFSDVVTFPVTFTEAGLPVGTAWAVALNGLSNSSTGSTLVFNEPNGSYSFSTAGAISGGPGIQYVATPASGSFDVGGAGYAQTVSYATQFELTTSATPSNAGTVGPASAWFTAGSLVELSALAGPGYQFASWQGSGAGNYTGPHNPVEVTLGAPVSEVAKFSAETASSSLTWVSGSIPVWVFLVSLGALVVVLALVALAGRRRRSPPKTPPPLRPVVSTTAGGQPPVAEARAEPWREDQPPS